MAARTKTVMRARALREHGADDIPTGPIVEVVTGADRILAGRIVEQVRLVLADVHGNCAGYAGIDVVEAQTRRVAGGLEGMSIGRAQGPLTNELRGAGEHAIARPLIKRLLDRRYFST